MDVAKLFHMAKELGEEAKGSPASRLQICNT